MSIEQPHNAEPLDTAPSSPVSVPPPSSLALGSGRVEVAWVKTFWLYSYLGLGLLALGTGLSLAAFLTSFFLAFLTLCIGHSVGLHRGIIHKTYATSRLVRWTFALLFAFSGLGGPLSWLKVHYTRDYWQNRADCPRFFRYDHGWFVGYVSHKIGYVRYAVDGASAEGRNVFFLGVISFGEGFHNNHHAYPASARMGVKWYELDLGWWVVRALEVLGVVHDVVAWHRPGFAAKAAAKAVDPRFIFRDPDQRVG